MSTFKGGYKPEENDYTMKGSYSTEEDYKDEIICYTKTSKLIFKDLYDNLKEKNKDFNFEEVIAFWKESLSESESCIENLGEYEDNDILQDGASRYVSMLENLSDDMEEFCEKFSDGDVSDEKLEKKLKKFKKKFKEHHSDLEERIEDFPDHGGMTNYDDERDLDYTYTGIQRVEFDENNPNLAPVHGVSLEDYAGAIVCVSKGVAIEDIISALGIELPMWGEITTLWNSRMQQDFSVTNLYGQYFQTAPQNPKFINLKSGYNLNEENIKKVNEDEMYYHELQGAIRAGNKYGIDTIQWLLDTHGMTPADLASAGITWMDKPEYLDHLDGQQKDMYKKYKKIFAEEQGGNVADDVEF